jgi:hypothetical protein
MFIKTRLKVRLNMSYSFFKTVSENNFFKNKKKKKKKLAEY